MKKKVQMIQFQEWITLNNLYFICFLNLVKKKSKMNLMKKKKKKVKLKKKKKNIFLI